MYSPISFHPTWIHVDTLIYILSAYLLLLNAVHVLTYKTVIRWNLLLANVNNSWLFVGFELVVNIF